MTTFKLLDGETVELENTKRSNVRSAVKRGAKWLDENYPNWRDNFDKDNFDIEDGNTCVFGQSTGVEINYFTLDSEDVQSLLNTTTLKEANNWLIYHGFYIDHYLEVDPEDWFIAEPIIKRQWAVLKDQWLRELA